MVYPGPVEELQATTAPSDSCNSRRERSRTDAKIQAAPARTTQSQHAGGGARTRTDGARMDQRRSTDQQRVARMAARRATSPGFTLPIQDPEPYRYATAEHSGGGLMDKRAYPCPAGGRPWVFSVRKPPKRATDSPADARTVLRASRVSSPPSQAAGNLELGPVAAARSPFSLSCPSGRKARTRTSRSPYHGRRGTAAWTWSSRSPA